jgi:hypothetical protein
VLTAVLDTEGDVSQKRGGRAPRAADFDQVRLRGQTAVGGAVGAADAEQRPGIVA